MFQECVVMMPAQALHQLGIRCLPAVSHDFGLLGANFSGLGADFPRVYPRPLDKKALAAPLPCTESAVMALKHCIATVTDSLLRGQDRGRSNSERLFALVLFELWRPEYGVAF